MIYILTGDVRTGKTTALVKWTSGRHDVDGILCPDTHDRRYFLKLKLQQHVALEVKDIPENKEIISVGRFHFLKSAFAEANAYIVSVFEKKTYKYLIIDELGKLELKNTGLHLAAQAVIKQHEFSEKHHIVLVVRSTLRHEILAHYNIIQFQLLEKEELSTLN